MREQLPSAKRMSDAQIVATLGKEKFSYALEVVMNFIESSCDSALSKLEYSALLSRALMSLKKYMSQMQVPFTVRTCLMNVQLIPYAIDLEFPGYASSKFLRTIVAPQKMQRVALAAALAS